MNKAPWGWLVGCALAGLLAAHAGAAPEDTTLHVEASRVVNHVTPWMYGSCIEDVNHEIYGGLYSQMIFGESFEEPPLPPPVKGWGVYGGRWEVEGDTASVAADAGAKIAREGSSLHDGRVECDVRLNDDRGDNAGLILRVSNPRTGADSWTGYELSLSFVHHFIILGKHNDGWKPLQTVPAPIQVGRWHRLAAELKGSRIRVFLDGSERPVLEYDDASEPILSGSVGLRTWNSNASFRHLVAEGDSGRVTDGFSAIPKARRDAVSGMWDVVRTGSAEARFAWDDQSPYNTARSQRIELARGEGTAGVANRGLNRWGLTVRKGHRYGGALSVRGEGVDGVTVALQSADGSRIYARQTLRVVGSQWSRPSFSLRSDTDDPNARFAVWIDRPGKVWLDQVFLSPTGSERFHGLPVRADIGNGLVAQGLTFMRYGGSMVNAPEYRWKKMIGSPEHRPQYRGWWYPQSTNGWGIEDFLRFAEAAHFEPVFAINIEETDQDAADLVEYLNGPADSPWGRKRAENGHPKPYGVRYLEIGNEEAIDGNHDWYLRYLARFHGISAAMHRKDPNLQLVIAAWWRPEEPLVKRIAQECSREAALWDVHVGGDELREGRNVDRIFTQMQRLLQEWTPGTQLKAAVFEENGGRHDLQRALGHAHILNVTQRHGDFVRMDCPANCLQPWKQNDNGWDQGQLFFTSGQVWGMPPYYSQQMAAENHEPLRVESSVQGAGEALDLTALRSEDGKTLVLRVVNLSASPHTARLAVDGFHPARDRAQVTELSGALTDRNTPEQPTKIVPTKREWEHHLAGGPAAYTFPPYSFTVIRLR